jgi:hypothetical protein
MTPERRTAQSHPVVIGVAAVALAVAAAVGRGGRPPNGDDRRHDGSVIETQRPPAPSDSTSAHRARAAPRSRPPRFVGSPWVTEAREAFELTFLHERKQDEALTAIASRLKVDTATLDSLREWNHIAAQLRRRIYSDPPVTSEDDMIERIKKARTVTHARWKAELFAFGGSWDAWNRYRQLMGAAEGGFLDLFDAHGNRIPGPNEGGAVIPSSHTVKHLGERDTTEFDPYFDR